MKRSGLVNFAALAYRPPPKRIPKVPRGPRPARRESLAMGRTVRRWALVLLAAALACAGGCSELTPGSGYVPCLLPAGGVVQTHAKPAGPGYFANFDPHACKLQVLPGDATNPVRTQHVLVA